MATASGESASAAANGRRRRAKSPRVQPGEPASGVLARIRPTGSARRGAGKAGADKGPIASRVDKHTLYEHAVQSVDAEIDFVDDTYKHLRGRRARVLREDFCGTANTSCEWVRRRAGNQAISVDLDHTVLQWGLLHNVVKLTPAQRRRIRLVHDDVLTVRTAAPDVVLAMNFSYWLFTTRDALRGYFRSVREHLAPGGVFFMDCYGGHEAGKEMREKREVKARGPWGRRFTYIWDQARFDPVTSQMLCHIHFAFEDGSRLNRAFTYRWRLWTLAELREILAEAGFARSTVYWEGWDEKDQEGDGDFQPVESAEADPSWISYLVAEK